MKGRFDDVERFSRKEKEMAIFDFQLPELMTTREVAEFLRVSEASVRRWTNGRILKCYRIGRSDERRFFKQDVVQFLTERAS